MSQHCKAGSSLLRGKLRSAQCEYRTKTSGSPAVTCAQRTCASFTSKHRPASRHRLKTFAFDSAVSFVGKLICHMRVCCFFMFCICSISRTRRMVRMIMILMIMMAMMCGVRLCYDYRVSVGPLCVHYIRIIHIAFARMLMSLLCVYMSFHSNTNLMSYFCSFPAQDGCQDKFSKAMSAPFVRKLPMDVAARIFEFGERLLGPIPTAPTKWEVRVGALPNGRPSNHCNVYLEFYMFECVSHTTVLTEKRALIYQVMWFIDSMISSTIYKSTPKGDMELTAEDIFSYWLD